MAASLCNSFSRLHVATRPQQRLSFRSNIAGTPIVAPQRVAIIPAATLTIQAKQNSLKRQRTAEKARVANKGRRSEIRTRMKKVLVALEGFKSAPPASESDLSPVQKLLSEAYQVIDKAVSKGIMHKNTAARRKARLATARRNVLISAGLYTPAE